MYNLGAVDYGIYAIMLSTITLLESPLLTRSSEITLKSVENGLSKSQFKLLIRNDAKYLILCYIAILPFVKYISAIYEIPHSLLYIYLFVLPLQIGYGCSKAYFIISNKILTLSKIEAVFTVLRFICFGIATYIGLFTFILVIPIFYAIRTLVFSVIVYRSILADDVTTQLLRSQKNDSAHALLRTTLKTFIIQMDLLLLGTVASHAELGIYKFLKSAASIVTVGATPFWRIQQPYIIKAVKGRDYHRLKSKVIQSVIWVSFISICAVPFIVIIYANLKVINFDDYYLNYLNELIFLIIGVFFMYPIIEWIKISAAVSTRRYSMQAILILPFIIYLSLYLISPLNNIHAYVMIYMKSGIATFLLCSIGAFYTLKWECNNNVQNNL